MRILHIITSLRTGGAERLVTDLLPRLRARGHEAGVLLFDGTPTPLLDELKRQNITVYTLGCGARQMRNPLHALRLRRYVRRERFDVVHTHNTPAQLLTALAAGKNAPILVTTEHNTFNRRRRWGWYGCVDRWMYGKYDHIACVGSTTMHNLMCELGGRWDEGMITVVPNGIDLRRFTGVSADGSLRTAAERDCRIAVMVSSFRAQKDQPTLIRALRHLPDDYRVWFAGDGEGLRHCRLLAEETGVAHRVRFLGIRSDIPELLAAADAVVLSSHYEGMSLSSIEGMASGRPFIASDVEGLHDIVEGAGLLFPHGDDESLAVLLRRVCEDAEFSAGVSSRCRARAMLCDIDKAVEDYENIYRKLVNKQTQ